MDIKLKLAGEYDSIVKVDFVQPDGSCQNTIRISGLTTTGARNLTNVFIKECPNASVTAWRED